MKNKKNRVYSFLLSVVMILSTVPIHNVGILANALDDGNHYLINGKPVTYESVEDPGAGKDSEYVQSLYEYVWGVSFSDDISSSDNIIKNVAPEDRILSPDNLENYIHRVQPGTVMKVETVIEDTVVSENGYTVFIVSSDSNGFTVFERTNTRKETYYTWSAFCDIYSFSSIRFLKWPNSYYSSDSIHSETDYGKPDRILYFDTAKVLFGDDVRWVQQRMNEIGYSVVIDGYFDKKCEKAVKQFQEDFSLNSTGIVDAETADMLEKPMKKPEKITLSLENKEDIDLSREDILTVTWDKVDYAESYRIMLYNSRGNLVDELEKVTYNKASFVVHDAGTYTVKGYAQNEKYVGPISAMEQKVKVHNTFTVRFLDDDGTLLNKQAVAFGQDAATPSSPKKTGYSFIGWDKAYTNITAATTITARYIRKTFTVTFKNNLGETIGTPQKVLYADEAVAPDTDELEGFVGWNKDFSFITQNTVVKAVCEDGEAELPVGIINASAIREPDSSGYSVYFTVQNNLSEDVLGRAVVALKTTAGKFLTLTESSAFVLQSSDPQSEALTQKAMKVFVPYSKAATIAEVYIVENYNDLVPISSVCTITEISTDNNYTDWLPESEAPDNPYDATEPRTEYRSSKKRTTTSSLSSLTGWTKYNYTLTYGDPVGAWSAWTTNYIAPSQDKVVDTKTDTIYTGYNMRTWITQVATSPHYICYWDYAHPVVRQSFGRYDLSKWVSINDFNSMAWVDIGAHCHTAYCLGSYNGVNMAGVAGRADNMHIYYPMSTTSYNATYYRYRNRTPIHTYYYYKWDPWSEWSTQKIKPSDTLRVETRQTRQYLVNDPTENNTGKSRTITGVLDASLAGKQATLFIYKINDASDYTNEYVGQTVIGENGEYKFVFKLREEPSVDTGDFTVTLGVEGTNTVFYLDEIKAPLPQYTVNFRDWDGSCLETQLVNKGSSAVLPTSNPTRPGYTFAGWNYSNASIYEDADITALYVQDEYTVVFIDWANEKYEMQTGYHYGDPLRVPDMSYPTTVAMRDADGDIVYGEDGEPVMIHVPTAREDYEAIGWNNVTDGMTVTENMVITADYEEKNYTVNFYDYDKNLIKTQTVRYGEKVSPPELISDEDHIFIAWDSYDYDCVKASLNIEPIYCYAETVKTPIASVQNGIYSADQTLVLSCQTPDSTIYYSLNGGAETAYTGPITIDHTTEIYFYAVCDEMNVSNRVDGYYVINKSGEQDGWKYPVKIYCGNSLIQTYLVDANSTLAEYERAAEPLETNTEIQQDANSFILQYTEPGAVFGGLYTDNNLTTEWNYDSDIVSSAMSLYIKLNKAEYTVDFCTESGTVVDSQNVAYMESAQVPEYEVTEEGKVFVRWDTDAYRCVTKDMTVSAVVKNSEDVSVLRLNRTELTTITGMTFAFSAEIEPETFASSTVVWESSDPSVAVIDANGRMKAVHPGEAVITASANADGMIKASCIVKVNANSSEEICFMKGSNLRIENGMLCGVQLGSNTVEEVFGQIDSNELRAFSDTGEELNNTDLLETGSVICLMDHADNIICAVTVVVSGDVNADGLVNNKDAVMISRYRVNKETLNEIALLAGDMDGDGSVSNMDVSMLLQYLLTHRVS